MTGKTLPTRSRLHAPGCLPKPRASAIAGDQVVGLIPAAGLATRISPLPCSKELLPAGWGRSASGCTRTKSVSEFLLEKMARAGVRRAFLILRSGKWDIPTYYGDGSALGMSLGYLMMGSPHGPAYTLDQAYAFVREARVVTGFGDILYGTSNPFPRLLARQASTTCDVVLGLYRSHDPTETDMVEVARDGRVIHLLIKPGKTPALKWTWLLAAWNGRFTEFLHHHLLDYEDQVRKRAAVRRELILGDVFRAAIDASLRLQTVIFPNDKYVDLGTPAGLEHALSQQFGSKP